MAERVGGAQIGYSLIEETGWKLDAAEITTLCAQARKDGITPRCLVRPPRYLPSPPSPNSLCANSQQRQQYSAFA